MEKEKNRTIAELEQELLQRQDIANALLRIKLAEATIGPAKRGLKIEESSTVGRWEPSEILARPQTY